MAVDRGIGMLVYEGLCLVLGRKVLDERGADVFWPGIPPMVKLKDDEGIREGKAHMSGCWVVLSTRRLAAALGTGRRECLGGGGPVGATCQCVGGEDAVGHIF